jgi:hypothetical protein
MTETCLYKAVSPSFAVDWSVRVVSRFIFVQHPSDGRAVVRLYRNIDLVVLKSPWTLAEGSSKECIPFQRRVCSCIQLLYWKALG